MAALKALGHPKIAAGDGFAESGRLIADSSACYICSRRSETRAP